MAWTAPTTRSTSDLITASIWNTDLVDNLTYLKSQVNSEIQILASSMVPSPGAEAAFGQYNTAGGRAIRTMDFIDTSVTGADFNFVLPSDYNGGTVTAKVFWTANSTSTNSVVWGIYMGSVADDGSLDLTLGTEVKVTDANKSTAYDLNITAATSAITIGGTPTAGKWAHFVIVRETGDGSDTLAVSARLLSVVITYTRA